MSRIILKNNGIFLGAYVFICLTCLILDQPLWSFVLSPLYRSKFFTAAIVLATLGMLVACFFAGKFVVYRFLEDTPVSVKLTLLSSLSIIFFLILAVLPEFIPTELLFGISFISLGPIFPAVINLLDIDAPGALETAAMISLIFLPYIAFTLGAVMRTRTVARHQQEAGSE
ncbi:MAG: hypothetical protein FWE85_01765 [Clostridiales bacterium]|nr:hypothetical protein [Clostridiales bacterium]